MSVLRWSSLFFLLSSLSTLQCFKMESQQDGTINNFQDVSVHIRSETDSNRTMGQRIRQLPMAISKALVNLQYVWPSAALWNNIHDGHVKSGIWNYGANVERSLENFIEKRHPSYNSAWDVACNLGIFLERLASKHPHRTFYGSDVSAVMVNATQTRCRTCFVEVFDVNDLQSEEFRPLSGHIPQPVDIIIVADVLYYMTWAGLPPFLNYVLPSAWTRAHRQTFWQHLTGLARTEVIFSGHQGNSAVTNFLTEMGATRIPLADQDVWVAPGMWGKAQFNHLPSSSWYSYQELLVLAMLLAIVIGYVAYRRRGLVKASGLSHAANS